MIAGDGLRVRLRPVIGMTPAQALARDFYFPAVLGDFEFEETSAHTEYDTVSAGQFSLPAPGGPDARQLRSVTLDVYSSDGDEPFLIADAGGIAETYAALQRIMRWKRPVGVTAWLAGGDAELRMNATIRRVSRALRHGQNGVRYFEVDFTEWRNSAVGGGDGAPATKPGLPTKHTLTATDTGRSLSKRYYGQYTGALTILYANGLRKWGPETPIVKSTKFKVGSRVTIPKPPKASINRPGVR